MELSNICEYSSKRIDSSLLTVENYVSTENMMQNKGGITLASKVPVENSVEFLPGDILISNIRPYFRKIWLSDKKGGCSSDVLCIRALPGTDSTYLYYLLSQDSFFDYVMSGAKGCKMPRGDKSQIMQWDVALPNFEEQHRIASILKSIDDKIQLNNRINHNLEQQAQALYKSWFVDFEPFRDGKFVESELGMIPEGWDAKPLSSICHIEKKTINPQKHPTCLFTHYSIPAYDNSELPELQKGSDILSNKYIISDYTILFSKLNPRIKRIWNVYKSESNPICSTEFVVYKPMDIDTYPFLYSFITGDDFYNNIMSKVNGATGSHQRFHPEETLDILVPYHIDCYRLYSQLVLPIIQQIDENKRENHYFASLRDSLLPKLMSGELKINDLTC